MVQKKKKKEAYLWVLALYYQSKIEIWCICQGESIFVYMSLLSGLI